MEIRSFLAFELPSEIKDMVVRVSGELRKSDLLHQNLSPFRNWEVDVFDRCPDLLGQHLGHLGDRHVLGPSDYVMLADVRFGIGKNACDDARDIFSRDGGVLSLPERKIQFPLLRDALA